MQDLKRQISAVLEPCPEAFGPTQALGLTLRPVPKAAPPAAEAEAEAQLLEITEEGTCRVQTPTGEETLAEAGASRFFRRRMVEAFWFFEAAKGAWWGVFWRSFWELLFSFCFFFGGGTFFSPLADNWPIFETPAEHPTKNLDSLIGRKKERNWKAS